MDITEKNRLIDAYRRYGFVLARDRGLDGALVFTLKTGYFDNAEIVRLIPNCETDSLFEEFTGTGYACTVRDAASPEAAEEELFQGFFSVDVTRNRLLEEYKRFSMNLVAPYGEGAQYSYIKAPYQINGKEGRLSPPEEVIQLMDDPAPVLFLIEAAAGFGKTCTAMELVKLLAANSSRIPLYAELSRNRQARIFRYILLDEIDRTFPLLSSGLVQTEIKNGRVAAILDGFDELLKKGEQTGDFENKEPMLETVSELLKGRAKIIITTRRTALFDGDDFHHWLDRHAESFKVVRIRIQEPRVTDWLEPARLEALEATGLRLDAMANPVLLSYLRCITSTDFLEAVAEPESIVESYFSYMLDRERDRQDLRMSIEHQGKVLQSIAKDMMTVGYTAEQREYLVNCILINESKLIDETRTQYPSSEKPSREEIANKLASHALLDRSTQDPNKIGFVNEFSLGNFVAANIISIDDWMGDELRFIEPAVRSYSPRTKQTRDRLFRNLSNSLPYLDITSQIEISAELQNRLPDNITDGAAEGLSLEGILIGDSLIKDFQFNECIFNDCTFDRSKIQNTTFLNCRFYDCYVLDNPALGPIHILGSTSSPEIIPALAHVIGKQEAGPTIDHNVAITRIVLKKFWPIGEQFSQRPSRPVYKPVKHLCHATADATATEIYEAVDRLKRQGLLEVSKSNLIHLNFEKLGEIPRLLEQGT